MAAFKVTEGSWKDQVGEFVRNEVEAAGDGTEKIVAVVLQMAGNRLVEFKPERVEAVEPEAKPEAEPEA